MNQKTSPRGRAIKITYWVATVWLCLGMTVSGVVQIIQPDEQMEPMLKLGFPTYFFTLLGIWKLLGVVALLAPKFPLVKEWAYAGFFFVTTGAFYSHLAVNDPPIELFGPSLLTVLIILSWYFRPESRRV